MRRAMGRIPPNLAITRAAMFVFVSMYERVVYFRTNVNGEFVQISTNCWTQ